MPSFCFMDVTVLTTSRDTSRENSVVFPDSDKPTNKIFFPEEDPRDNNLMSTVWKQKILLGNDFISSKSQ